MSRPKFLIGSLAIALAVAACGPDDPDDPDPTLAEGIYGPLGTIIPTATDEERATFERGLALAENRITPETGLGPEFNVAFCGACHESPVIGGSAPRYRDFYINGTLLDDGTFIGQDFGGVSHLYGIGDAPIRPTIPAGTNVFARRSSIPFFGVGLIAEIYEEAILANVDEDDADGDGISGRANFADGFVGRFGRKAQTNSIEGFIRGPLMNHLGLTSDPLTEEQRARLPVDSSQGNSSGQRTAQSGLIVTVEQAQAGAPDSPLFDTDDIPDPELAPQDLFDLVSFSMLLAAPQPDTPTPESTRGNTLFDDLACSSCHVQTLESPRGLIPLYSDLLIHDMGAELSDGLPMELAGPTEFRTQPLWGIAAAAPYLHDGRADTLDEAIRFHGGEAAGTRDAYVALGAEDQAAVIAFLESLGGLDQRSNGRIPPNTPIPAPGEPGAPITELTGADAEQFLLGRSLFDHNFYRNEGLGLTFNGDSCRACHFDPVFGGSGPIDVNVIRHGTWDGDTFIEPPDGTILHRVTDSLLPRIEQGSTINVYEPRQTPTTLGLGLVDGISEAAILANADPDDADGDGIRGVTRYTADGRIGRLGWTLGVPTVREFVRDAMSAELGMSMPEESDHTFGFTSDDDGVADPELAVDEIDAITYFITMMDAPQADPIAPGSTEEDGRTLFTDVGCEGCHLSELDGVPLYSDLLLHVVAPDDYLGVPDGPVAHNQFRTPPLWGVSDTSPFMHDGFSSTLDAAIRRHFGEADATRVAYEALTGTEQSALIAFLESL